MGVMDCTSSCVVRDFASICSDSHPNILLCHHRDRKLEMWRRRQRFVATDCQRGSSVALLVLQLLCLCEVGGSSGWSRDAWCPMATGKAIR